MYVFSSSLSFVVSLLRGTSKVTRNTQKRSNRMEHCIEVKWVSATYRCSSTAMSAAPVGRMQMKNQSGQSWANCQDQMESKNSRARKPRASFEMLWAGTISKDFHMDTERMTNSWLPTPFSVVIVRLSTSFGYWYSPFRRLSWLPSVPFWSKHHVKSGNQQQISEGSAQSTELWFISSIIVIPNMRKSDLDSLHHHHGFRHSHSVDQVAVASWPRWSREKKQHCCGREVWSEEDTHQGCEFLIQSWVSKWLNW